MSKRGFAKFLKCIGGMRLLLSRGRLSRITSEVKPIVDEQMHANYKTTVYQIHILLNQHGYSISLQAILRCQTSFGWMFWSSTYCQLIQEVNKQKRLEWAKCYEHKAATGVLDVMPTPYTFDQHGYSTSLQTILWCQTLLGWMFCGSAYCQLIQEVYKQKRLEWAKCYEHKVATGFLDVIWTDECTVQLETHWRWFSCHKRGERPKTNQDNLQVVCSHVCVSASSFLLFFSCRVKHPVKLHVLAGISLRGPTDICIFDDTMDAVLFTKILDRTLLPYLRDMYPDDNQFMQDNDPKHSSEQEE